MMQGVRRVVLILTVVSGLLCAGFVVAYAYAIRMDGFDLRDVAVVDLVNSNRCRARLGRSGLAIRVHTSTFGLAEHDEFGLLGIRADIWASDAGTSYGVYLPYWMLISSTAVLPVVYVRRLLILRHRCRAGRCLTCGYDLRESKERCPECGTPVSPHPSPSPG